MRFLCIFIALKSGLNVVPSPAVGWAFDPSPGALIHRERTAWIARNIMYSLWATNYDVFYHIIWSHITHVIMVCEKKVHELTDGWSRPTTSWNRCGDRSELFLNKANDSLFRGLPKNPSISPISAAVNARINARIVRTRYIFYVLRLQLQVIMFKWRNKIDVRFTSS